MRTASRGYAFVELLFMCALLATLGGMAIPELRTAVDDYRTAGAARYLSARLQRMRMEAVKQSADVAMRFMPTAEGFNYGVYVDGNRNGVRTADIDRLIDWLLSPAERLSHQFPGVDIGVLPDLPGIDGGPPPGNDPLKLGSSNMLSFTAAGTSSSGSVYIRGRNAQYAVRVFGETGRTRVLRFIVYTKQWNQL
jgi:hypothetical protein